MTNQNSKWSKVVFEIHIKGSHFFIHFMLKYNLINEMWQIYLVELRNEIGNEKYANNLFIL